MNELTYAFELLVSESLEQEFSRRIYFISDSIQSFSLLRRDQDRVVLSIEVLPGTSREELARKIDSVLQSDIFPQRSLGNGVHWRSAPPKEPLLGQPFTALEQAGAAVQMAEGLIALGEPMISLIGYLDSRVRSLAISKFCAAEFRYPTLIPTAVLSRCQYLESFPQHVMFVTRLHTDADVYGAFCRQWAEDRYAQGSILGFCRNADYALPPTMCFHTYHQLADTTIPADGKAFTAAGKSFRFESHYSSGLERLWDFTIREMVFVGRREFVLACRSSFMAATIELMDELGLQGRCEVAADPFFLGDSASKAWAQRLHELKYELILGVGGSREVAVGSFNFHDRFFGEAFNISVVDGGAASTACVGIGLERLALAYVARHGITPETWPINLRLANQGISD